MFEHFEMFYIQKKTRNEYYRGHTEGVPRRRILRRNFSKKRRIFPNVQSYEGKNRLSRGEIGRAWRELHFRFSFSTQ